jgi:hypothetical protein
MNIILIILLFSQFHIVNVSLKKHHDYYQLAHGLAEHFEHAVQLPKTLKSQV